MGFPTLGFFNYKLISDGPSPTVLHEVSVPIISNDECYEWFSEAGYAKPVPKTMMCAGFKEGGKDSCQVIINRIHTIIALSRLKPLLNTNCT